MKKALSLLFMFIIFLFAGSILATLFYSFFLGVLNYVVGLKVSIFEIDTIINSFFYILPLIIMLIPSVLSYYRVRHFGTLPQIITYLIICVLSWGVFLPLTIKAQEHYFRNNSIVYQKNELTPNYFRQDKKFVYYFTKELSSDKYSKNIVPTVIIDTSEEKSIEIKNNIISKNFVLYRDAYPFTDIIIKDTFSTNKLRFFIDYKSLLDYAYSSLNHGISFYLGFLTLALALTSLFAFTNIFSWKLLNSIFIIFSTIILFFINTYYFSPSLDSIKTSFINNNSFFIFLEAFVDNPFLCIINISIFLIQLSVFIINKLIKKTANK